jgi:L-arabinonolactonase
MKQTCQIDLVHNSGDLIGECPLWHPEERALYWIDTRRPSLHRLDRDGVFQCWTMPEKIGSFVFHQDGGLVVGLERGFCRFDPVDESVSLLFDPEPGKPNVRLNDGKCDPMGRYWCGSMHSEGREPLGSLHSYSTAAGGQVHDTGFIVSNGMAFSPDGKTLIFGDSTGDIIYRYDLDLQAGTLRNKRPFLDTCWSPWVVDGATFDDEGYYWCALIKDGAVGRFDLDGRLDRLIRVPVRFPTMCNFGGADLDVLYVTSGNLFLTEDERRASPESGALFAITGLGVRGVPEPMFLG